jgi:hypothetical protein
VRRSLMKDSIYTRKLTLRGESVPETMRADVQLSGGAARIMRAVHPDTLAAFVAASGEGSPGSSVAVLAEDSLWEVVTKMRTSDASVALVTEKDGHFIATDVKGIITRKDLIDALAKDMELFNG